jgi:hypothetical protein
MNDRNPRAPSRARYGLLFLTMVACSQSSAGDSGHDAGPDSVVVPDSADAASTSADVGGGRDDAGQDAGDTTVMDGAFAYFVKQANGTTTASLSDGILSVSAAYGSSGNAFKYVAPNYYGTSSNGFIALPTPMTGDFSMSAEVTVSTQNKSNNACGIGLGMTSGFNPTDAYAYILMRNSSNVAAGYYVNGAGTISAGSPNVPFGTGTPLHLTFSRTGNKVSYGAGPVGQDVTSNTVSTSALTDGSNVYGEGPVYPVISWNNVEASVAHLMIKDADGKVVFDSTTGRLESYVPAALSLSAANVSVGKGKSVTVTATANAVGGAVAEVTAVSSDPDIASVSVQSGKESSTLTVEGLAGGVATITVTNVGDTNATTNTKMLLVAVNDYPTTDDYGQLQSYPAPGAKDAFPDGELALTFDDTPTLHKGGSIKIFKLSDGSEVDSIGFADETQVLGGIAIKVGSQLVRVEGKTVYVRPHNGRLGYGSNYYVAIPTTAIEGTLNGLAFKGLSNASDVATWRFTTKDAPALDFSNVTVDGSQTSSADFRSLQAALDMIAGSATPPTEATIHVAAGTYHELLRYAGKGASAAQTVTISGPAGNDHGDTCVFQFANGNNVNGSTQTRATFYFNGANLVLENLAFKNTAVRAEYGQAETLYFASGPAFTVAAYNSAFYSNQDTLQTTGRNWFYKCRIEGNVDFIWGTAQAALFEDCSMRFINDLGGNAASYSLVVARTGSPVTGDGTVGKGYVVLDSTVSVDANVTASFGRDAGTGAWYDQVALVGVTFTGEGSIGAGLWNISTPPLSLGDASYVGWKSAACSGLNLDGLTTAAGTSSTIADEEREYDSRDHILNRVVTVAGGQPTGYEAASTSWDVSALAKAWGAP